MDNNLINGNILFYIILTRLYNFINDTLVAESTVLGH